VAAPTPSSTWAGRLAALVALFLGGERVLALVRAPATDFDDAYMFLRYAHNLLAGFGMRWNRGEAPVFGATSLPHVLVVALVRRECARLSDAAVLQLSSGVAAGLLVVALALTCARFAHDPRLRRQPWIWAALLAVTLAYGEPFRFHAATGMDTMLAALANTGVVYAALAFAEAPGRRRALVAAVVGYLAYLVRPDNAIYAALVPVLAVALNGPAGRRRAPLVVFALALAALVAADLLVKQRWLGSALPLGAYAKRPWHYAGFAGEFTWNPFWFLRVFLGGVSLWLVALVLFCARACARLVVALLVPAALGLATFFGVNQIMGHLGRFYFPALPFIVIAAALALDRAMTSLSLVHARALLARAAGAAVLLAGGGWALTAAGARYQARAATQVLAPPDEGVGYTVAATAPLPELDSWRSSQEMALFARDAPAGTRFAMSEHGLVGASAPAATIIDVLGLHDPIFARAPFRAAELWRRDPDVIWVPHPDHTQMVRAILDSDQLWAGYDFFPDLFTYGVAVRRDGARAEVSDVLARLLRARVAVAYPGLSSLDDYRARRAQR
jgi:hypothetical protein